MCGISWLAANWSGVEPATSQSRVWCPNGATKALSHYFELLCSHSCNKILQHLGMSGCCWFAVDVWLVVQQFLQLAARLVACCTTCCGCVVKLLYNRSTTCRCEWSLGLKLLSHTAADCRVCLGGLVVSALGMRTRRPRFKSRVAPLFHWVATLGKLFTRIASPVSQLQETGVQKGVFGA